MEKPNIITVMMDQFSAKWFEAALNGVSNVPNFKRFMKRGISFSHAYTNNPVCTPARSTIATGLTTRQHGVLQNGYMLDPSLPTYMQLLQKSGYRSGLFGKLHLHPHYMGLYPDYAPYGFDVAHVTEDPRGGEWITKHALDFIENESGNPFYAHISYVQPHGPHCSPGKYFQAVNPDLIPKPISPVWPNDPLHPSIWDRPGSRCLQKIPENWKSDRHAYFADIAHLDVQFGRILDKMDLTGLIDSYGPNLKQCLR